MEQNQNNKMVALSPQVAAMQQRFEMAALEAKDLQIQNNACTAFKSVIVVKTLREVLNDQVMNEVFMPLMNTKIGFRTDRDPNRPVRQKDGTWKGAEPYPVNVVRDCIIEAVSLGLLPTGNQFNIISGTTYPTKEGYTALLKKIGCKYFINYGPDNSAPDAKSTDISCKVFYNRTDSNGKTENGDFTVTATVKKDAFSSYDQIKGKAERRAKKVLFEYLTGCDFGDADEESSIPDNKVAAERESCANTGEELTIDAQPTPVQQNKDWRKEAAQRELSKQAEPEF